MYRIAVMVSGKPSVVHATSCVALRAQAEVQNEESAAASAPMARA